MSLTITLHLWWLWAYLAIGVVLFLPVNYLAWKSIHRPDPFWATLWRGIIKRPLGVVIQIVAWPLGLWEAFR